MQKRAIRAIFQLGYRDHTSVYFDRLGFLSFDSIVKQRVCMHMFNIVNSIKPDNICKHYQKGRNARTLNYIVPYHRTKFRAKSILINGPKLWNQLKIDIKTIDTKKLFKKKLKPYLAELNW